MRALEFVANIPVTAKYTETISSILAQSVSGIHLPVIHAAALSENDFR